MEFHLLLHYNRSGLGMFGSYDFKQILGQYFCPLNLTFIWTADA
jgi:hypothetical protein